MRKERLHPLGQHCLMAYLSIMPKSDRDRLLFFFWKVMEKNNKTGIHIKLR